MALPANITVKRSRTDTYPEVFSVVPLAAGSTFDLTVVGLGSLSGVSNESAKTVSFTVSSDVALGARGSYDYSLTQTTLGLTRTIATGKWLIKT